jgi:hypothetical protein
MERLDIHFALEACGIRIESATTDAILKLASKSGKMSVPLADVFILS